MKKLDLLFTRSGQISFFPDAFGCWIWQGSKDRDGYGKIGNRAAHRLFYQEFVGDIPLGYEVHHKCEMRICVNPLHLAALSREEHIKTIPGGPLATKPHYKTLKTHCPQGHPYCLENTIVKFRRGGRQRHCRICNKEYCKDYYRRRRAA